MIITFLGYRSIINGDAWFEKVRSVILENINFREKTLFYCGG